MNDLFYFMDGVSINAYAGEEQIYDSDKDPVRLGARCHLLKADHWFGVNGMISNPDQYQARVLGNTNHAFIFHVNSIKIPVTDRFRKIIPPAVKCKIYKAFRVAQFRYCSPAWHFEFVGLEIETN